MQPFLQNKFVKFSAVGLVAIVVVILFLSVVLTSLNDARGLATSGSGMNNLVPSVMPGGMIERYADDSVGMMAEKSSYYMPPQPNPGGYTSGLESYETTSYSITASTKQFDDLCKTMISLKADSQIHFKSINESTNNCRATFFVDESKANAVLSTFTTFKGVEYNRNTVSVTRHRQQIQSQTDIIQQQLASASSSLSAAETQFDELANFARQSKDASALSEAIRYKLQNVDSLTQRKINLTNQLNNLYQQATDLEERMNVVQFDVNINRSNPIYPNQDSQKWENAWKQLSDTYTNTLIGLTAFFGIFLLEAIKYTVYLLVLIVILRGLWKFIRLIWNKW